MKLKFNHILILLVVLFTQISFAQDRTVNGTVTDDLGVPLPGVSVILKGTKISVQTNSDGKFSIKASTSQIISFSYIGTQTQEIKASATTFNVKLKDASQNLDEVVVVAYGKVKKSSQTGSVSQIKAEQIQNRPLTNALSVIEGSTSGVQIQSAAGQPGSAPAIRIRGFSSISGSNTPLYIVDGVPYAGDISSINSNDIESVSVLKDAATTSLYGSKAANGVVIITTKTGKSLTDKVSINISQSTITRGIKEYYRVNAFDYYPLEWEAIRNSRAMATDAQLATANAYSSTRVQQVLINNPFNVPNAEIVGIDGKLNPSAKLLYPDDLDWAKQLSRTGIRQNADISYQGRSEKSNYFASIGNLKEDGYIYGSSYERTSGRVNLNSKLKDWFKVGTNLTATIANSNLAVNGVDNTSSFNNPFRSSRYMGPIYPIHNHEANGDFTLDSNGEKTFTTSRASGAANGRNIVYETLNNVDEEKRLALSGRTYFEITFLKDFKLTTNASIDKSYFNRTYSYNTEIGDGAPAGLLGKEDTILTGVTYNQLLDYSKKIGEHNISALFGHESFDYETNFTTGTKTGQVSPDNTEFINYATTTNLSSYSRNYSTESYFSRVGYDYMSKYVLSASFRRDGSSKFAKDTRWGNFWSVGTAWNISNEKFLENNTLINDLKIRASIGETGNDSHTSNTGLSFYASQATFSLGFDNGSEGGTVTNAAAATNLKWEVNTQKDVAVEFGLFKNRLKGSVEYYHRNTDGLIFSVPNPLSTGLDDRIENIGSMYNSGFEVYLDGTLLKSKDFSWNLNINASTIHNELTSLPQKEIISGTKKLAVGRSIYDYWLRDWYGVDPADGYALYVADPTLIVSGDSSARVVNGVNVTTDQNKALYHYADSAIPDLFGSFTNTFKYKGIQLDILFTYQLGGKIYDSNYQALMHTGNNYGSALSTDILNRWQKPGDITDIPRLDINRNTQSSAASDRWLVDSDYLALRQINLSYKMPTDFIKKMKIDNATVYVNGENLLLFTKRVGMDPTQTFNGTTQNRFTPSRVISLGLNLNF